MADEAEREIPLEETEGGAPKPPESSDAPAAPEPPADPPPSDDAAANDASHIDLEPIEAAPKTAGVASLDVCPNCGAGMREGDSIVCLRCGYDLKSMSVLETEGGVAEVEPEEATVVPALTNSGFGGEWLPLAVAGVGTLILFIAYLAGAPGLFLQETLGDSITVGRRIGAVGRFALSTVVWTGAGLLTLIILAEVLATTVGNVRLAAIRMLGIAVALGLVALVDLGDTRAQFETAFELFLQGGVLLALLMAFFGLTLKRAGMGVVIFAVVLAALWGMQPVIGWVYEWR